MKRLQGPRMVRDVFRLAKENAPAIIFIDEVDAIATARFDAQTGADRCAMCRWSFHRCQQNSLPQPEGPVLDSHCVWLLLLSLV